MTYRRRFLAALAAAAALAAVASGPAAAAPPTGTIALAGENGGISTLDPSTGALHQLTSFHGEYPSISPDGGKIAFASEISGSRDLYVMNADGTNVQQLTFVVGPDFDQDPTWSADGTKIAFGAYRGGLRDVWVMNADGTNQHRLTLDGSSERPSWSTDGSEIAYERATTGNLEIWVMNADGTGQHQVTFDGDIHLRPDWSPDGARIAYSRGPTLDTLQIWTVALAGGAQTQLTFDGASDQYPTWSPDGNWIAYSSNADPAGYWDIFAVPAAGGAPVNLTNTPGLDVEPDWGVSAGAPPPDTTPPSVPTATVPGDGTDLQSFAFSWTTDEPATARCQIDTRGFVPCTSPWTATSFSDGTHTFTLVVTDAAGNSSTFTHSWIEDLNSPSGNLAAGGTLTTDPLGFGAQPSSPVEVALTSPVAGPASISESAVGTPPAGYQLLGREVDITAPAASAASPLSIVFEVDRSVLGSVTAATLQLFRNGVAIADCPGASQAVPDPCISARVTLPNGNVRITVNTSHASRWNVGVRTSVADQLADLKAKIRGYHLPRLIEASLLLEAQKSCLALKVMLVEVDVLRRARVLSAAQAVDLTQDVKTILKQLGC